MSQILHETINVPNVELADDRQYIPLSAQNQPSPNASTFVDGSGHIFSMYLDMASEEDKKMVESWKADADGILIFTGLFSAAVASLISVSIQDIQQNPQDTSNFYLANIYQTLADPNGSNISSSLPASPPPFTPPRYAVWVNALWFLSLVISLTCALLATLLQQWARRYLKITQSRYSPHKRARIRAFFSEGVEKCLLPWTVETLPTLLHISLFLFFAGLVVFLCNVNLTIFKLVLSWVGLCTALYGCITCMPIFRHDSPYYTPLSLPAWYILTGVLFSIYRFLRWCNRSVQFRDSAYRRFLNLEEYCRKSLVRGMQKTAEETALKSSSEIDTRAFMWTFDCLDEDHELERFFSGLPGFRSSRVATDPLPSLTEEETSKLYRALIGLLRRTFSSDLLPAPVKNRRAIICAKAVDPEHTPNAWRILEPILSECQYSGPLAIAIAKILRGWGNNVGEDNIFYVQFAISMIIATRQPYDDSWYILASNELGTTEAVLRDYATDGDSLSLFILIHIFRQQFSHFREPFWMKYNFAFALAIASNLNVKNTSQELQHDFCALWNQVVREVQHGDDRVAAFRILRRIRHVFLSLHQDTDSSPTRFSVSTNDNDDVLKDPTSYPVCKVSSHHSDSTTHIHDDDVSATIARTVRHDHNNTPLAPSISNPDLPPSSTHTPPRVDETLTDALPLDNHLSIPGPIQHIGQTTTESPIILTTSPSPVTACTTHGMMDLSSRMVHHSASGPSASSPPPKVNASASPPDDVAVGHTALSCAPSDDLNVLSSPYPTPALDDMPPTESHPSISAPAAEGGGITKAGLSTKKHASYSTSVIREDIEATVDLPPKLPTESHSSTLAPAAEGEGSAKASLRTAKVASYPTSTIREDIMATVDLPPQLPSPSPVTDLATDGPPTRSLGTEHIEHRHLDPMHIPYDIV